MNIKLFSVLAIALAITVGCVSTPTGHSTAAVPFVKDSVEGRYERPVQQVYTAAKDVIRFNGTLLSEVTQHSTNGTIVLAIEGRVQSRKVFVGVKDLDGKITEVAVQVRTSL